MKRFSKNHVGVSPETYKAVFERDNGRCALCGNDNPEMLHLHHIQTRSHKSLIDVSDNCIMLCWRHHQLVHQDMNYWRPILQKMVAERKRNALRKK